jgi:hypothetical protein
MNHTRKPEPQHAKGTDLHAAIRIALDETFTALAESIAGLTDEQFNAWPIERRNSIATLTGHCIQALDLWAVETHGRTLTYPESAHFDVYNCPPEQVRQLYESQGPRLDVDTAREHIEQVRSAALAHLDATDPDALAKPTPDCWWFEENPGRIRSDAYWRAIHHNNAHVRQIWALRGVMGLVDAAGQWPRQHWA